MRLPSFSAFIQILNENNNYRLSIVELGRELKRTMDLKVKDSTAAVYAKIMLNWARKTELAPRIYGSIRQVMKPSNQDELPFS
jgi:hypothetical protein